MSSSDSPVIRMENVSFTYREMNREVLNKFSLKVFPGECILLCGESGCGKTTVTRMINGLIPHYYEGSMSGSIEVCGLNPGSTPLERLAEKAGSVFQNPRSQFFCVDTTSEIAFGCENMGLPEKIIRDRIENTARQMKLQNLLGRNIFRLSGGEKQKIACAGVSVMQPEIFVLDEPTSNLDSDAVRGLAETLLLWKKKGKTIIIAEHRLSWLKNICDRVVFLRAGTVSREFTADNFFEMDDEKLHALGLRGAEENPKLQDGPTGFYPLNDASKFQTSEKLIFSDFIYGYGKKQVLNIPRLEIPEHAVVAVIGRNGAGKSTFAGCLCGLKKGFRGRVTVCGKTYAGKDIRKLSYMVMQDVNHQLFSESVLEEVTMGMTEENEENEEKAAEILTQLNLVDVCDRHPMSLSGGQKQRTAIASALVSDRPVLILDEPTSGQDFRKMQETAALIRKAGNKKTIFIVTHDMELVQQCCTHVLHMENIYD